MMFSEKKGEWRPDAIEETKKGHLPGDLPYGGPAPKSVNPSLGCSEHKLSGLKRTDLVERGCKGRDIFLGWSGMLLFHLIRSYGVWSSNCLVKFPSHPLPPDPRSGSVSHFCPHSAAHLFLLPFHYWEN